jgi:hypothetical protein
MRTPAFATLVAACLGLSLTPPARALDRGLLITKATQGQHGLDFELSAVQEGPDAVVVRLSVPKTGRLADLTGVRLSVTDGKRFLTLVPVATAEADGRVTAWCQLTPEVAGKASLDLYTVTDRVYAFHYAVQVGTYVEPKK